MRISQRRQEGQLRGFEGSLRGKAMRFFDEDLDSCIFRVSFGYLIMSGGNTWKMKGRDLTVKIWLLGFIWSFRSRSEKGIKIIEGLWMC